MPRSIHVDCRAVDSAAVTTSDARSAAVVRVVLSALGFDERRLFAFHIEEKLSAYELFRPYGMPMPRTAGLNNYLRRSATSDELDRALIADFGKDYVVKPVYGAGSGDAGTFDHRDFVMREFATISAMTTRDRDGYIVQERIAILREVRVHTIERSVIREMTFPRYRRASLNPDIQVTIEHFAEATLGMLPDFLVRDSLYGWDVAETPAGFVVIEINPTGFHPEWCRGYQTTGFVQEGSDADRNLARLLDAIESIYSVDIIITIPPKIGHVSKHFGAAFRQPHRAPLIE